MCLILTFSDKIEESFPNSNTVMRNGRPLHGILVYFIAKYPHGMSNKQNFGDDFVRKLGMTLNRNVSTGEIHSLYGAESIATKGNRVFREVLDDVAVHLVDAL